VAILAYVFRRRAEAGIVVMVASIAAAIGLCIALSTVWTNFTLLSTVSTPFVSDLPYVYVITLVAGLVFCLWLRSARPQRYAQLALVEHRDAA